MINQKLLEKIVEEIEELQNTNRATQEEKDAMKYAKSELMRILS